MRLGDLDALKNDLITFFPDKCLEGITAKTLFKQILTDIDNAPTVTPDKIQAIMSDYLVYRCEPQRPQGKWIEIPVKRDLLYNTGIKYTCSICGKGNCYGKPPFCMYCGADMRKGGAENDT